ncbi:MAG: Uma2 family endonuclease [Planctomycetes bacterium]|nr:Uma2 family endonuclease [Planctomycetota bacterium]
MMIATPSLGEYKQTILDLLPNQGHWSDEEYLWLTDHTTRLVEFTDGNIEPLPMPTDLHQSIAEFFLFLFTSFLNPQGGKAHMAAVRLKIRRGKYREPDVLLVKSAKDKRRRNRYWVGADLTLEVVSKDKPERDLVEKRGDYAEGKVPEYWIVNPQAETITVLRLDGAAYVEHGVFTRGQNATSVILPGFSVNVDEVFDIEAPPDNPDDDDE